ncbi:NADH dehydrogenase [ubiquinone] 1 alpha subcomplex subunit 1 [Lethenteron reissneri]|uniref:NADH dehydrogenase [ubiquinone] 1 alpha subcomplex subunit 1 n=1 Tax=Lethenteron reissneri TaxID=7753 RepID=UPI002AB707B7|nr:NADH dehydrogenase [ubiquinone] 1 alpha subcomplex subunit 1 [Lethenteron reissneri]
MWYEILPGLAVMTVALMVPGFTTMFLQRASSGWKEKRVVSDSFGFMMLKRDARISGTNTYYQSKGLENIN